MSNNDICTTIKELAEQIESLESEIQENNGLIGLDTQGLHGMYPGLKSHAIAAIEQNNILKLQLKQAKGDLARTYQQNGDEDMAMRYFALAERC